LGEFLDFINKQLKEKNTKQRLFQAIPGNLKNASADKSSLALMGYKNVAPDHHPGDKL